MAAGASNEPLSPSASSGIRFVVANDDPAMTQLNRFYNGPRTTANSAFVAQSIAKHAALPKASIAVISSNSEAGQSAAFPDPVTGECYVQIAVDSRGLSEAPRNAGVLHRELYADAFAAIRYIQARSADPVGSVRELAAIQHWRSVSTHDHLADENPESRPSEIQKPRFDKAEHATATLIADIVKRPKAFLLVDADEASGRLASSHLGKFFSTASDASQTAQTLLDHPTRIFDSIAASLPSIWAEGASKADAQAMAQKAKKQFDFYQYGSPVERAIFEQTDLFGRIALERAPAYLTAPDSARKPSWDEKKAQRAKSFDEISEALARHPDFKASLARLGYGPEQATQATQALNALQAAEKPLASPESLWPAADKLAFRKTFLEWRSGRQSPADEPSPGAPKPRH